MGSDGLKDQGAPSLCDKQGAGRLRGPKSHLTVVVVAYQEEEALGPLIEELFEALEAVEWLEVIIVNDGSSDRTAEVMEALNFPEGRAGRLECIHLSHNQGMGAALKAGYRQATGDWVTFLPGDGQLAPASLEALFQVADQGVALVTTRYTNRSYTPLRWALSKGLRVLNALIVGTRVHSEGMYLFQRSLLQDMTLHSDSFMLNLELPIRVARMEREVGLAWIKVRARQGGVSSATRFGRIFSTLTDLIALRVQLERETLSQPLRAWAPRALLKLCKLLFVVGAVGWAAQSGLLTQTSAQLESLSPIALMGAWLLMGLGISLGALRWLCLLKATGLYQPPLARAVKLCYEGLFFNVLVPGSVGGDLLRAHWLKRQDPTPSNLHFVITLGERVLGMVSLGLWVAVGVAPAWLITLTIMITLGVISLSPQLVRLLTSASLTRARPRQGWLKEKLTQLSVTLAPLSALRRGWVFMALGVNTLGHMTSFALFILVAHDLGIQLPLSAWLMSLSVSLFFANLPLSVAGVGPRELSMVATLGVYGISEERALALSLSSLAILITHALCGGLLHLIWPTRTLKT